MKVATIDTKRRLVLPGDSYAVSQSQTGYYDLTQGIYAPKNPKHTPEELDASLVTTALTPKRSWEELSNLTREP